MLYSYQGASTIVAEWRNRVDGYFRPHLPLPDGAYRVEQTTYKEGYVSSQLLFTGLSLCLSGLGDVDVAELENQPLGYIIVKVVGTDGNLALAQLWQLLQYCTFRCSKPFTLLRPVFLPLKRRTKTN